MLAICGGLVQC